MTAETKSQRLEIWKRNGLNPDNYSNAVGEAMEEYAKQQTAWIPVEKFPLAIETLKSLSLPLAYDPSGQSVVDQEYRMIADIRGWGWLQKAYDGDSRMDEVGELIAALLNSVAPLPSNPTEL